MKKKGKNIKRAQMVSGTYRSNPRGFGFVVPDSGGDDVFIPQGCGKNALNGDRVVVQLDKSFDERGPSGVVVEILERATTEVVGCLSEHDGAMFVAPIRRDLPALIPLSNDSEMPFNSVSGDWVSCNVVYAGGRPVACIAKKLGKSGSIAGDLKAICEEYALPKTYTSAAEEKAKKLQPEQVKRHDCLDLDVFTIDPVDARDFDDGISYVEKPPFVEIGVHIADVACFVPHGSALDKAAAQRGFTSYLPGRTIGMLPDALSSDRCSLREGDERLAHSVFLTVNPETGEVKKSRRIHTLIKSRHRLNYDQVDRVLEGDAEAGVDEALANTLKAVNRIAVKMRKWREITEEFLPFEAEEIRVICSGQPLRLLGVKKTSMGASSKMIEEFMLAANSAVAKEMSQRRICGLYRIHPEPEKEALSELAGMARTVLRHKKNLNFGNRGRFISFLKSINGEDYAELLTLNMVRCMSRAKYSVFPAVHFGLGKSLYCHFTSPIRRYPDLLTHQQLFAADSGGKPVAKEKLAEFVDVVNDLEYNNDQASFAVSDRFKMRLVSEKMRAERGTTFECLVAKASAGGLQLYLREYGLMGFMDVETLGGKWRFDRKSLVLENLNRHTRYRVGDIIFARPFRLDTVRGELLMKPAEFVFF